MPLEIITIGDEILSGNVVDTNTAWLSDKLWLNGFEITYHTGVRDDEKTIQEALLLAASRAEIVLVTGGLGPTADDFTIEVAAKTFKKKLILDDSYIHYLERLFSQWGRTLSENNKKQALIPQGAKIFPNRAGTAPGIRVKYKKTMFYFMPGVPKEMKQLFDDFILSEIISYRKQKIVFQSQILKCFGAAEADLDLAIKDLYVGRLDIENVRIGFRAHFPDTFIKLSAWHAQPAQAQKILKNTEERIRERVGKYIYGEGEDTLESVLGALLTKNKKTLAVAESCTGGLIAHRLTNVPGSSNYFLGGIVSYGNEVKMKLLGVSPKTLSCHGAVSAECAIEMAQGVRKNLGADFGISVTGIAGPTGGTQEKPVGTVHIALAHTGGVEEKKYFFPCNRDWFKLLVSSLAMDKLRKKLIISI